MKSNRIVCLVTVFALGLGVTASAAEYKIDSTHSNAGFTIRHLVSKVNGEFKDLEGSFSFDQKKPAASKVTAKIKTASISTNNSDRDDHLRGSDFFDASKNEFLSFESKKITAAGKNKYKMLGDLTMRGVTKPVTFNVEYLGSGKDMKGQNRTGFTATGKVNRKDFGISWNKALDAGGFVLGDDVQINLNVEAVEAAAE